jgi:hypothetical protein
MPPYLSRENLEVDAERAFHTKELRVLKEPRYIPPVPFDEIDLQNAYCNWIYFIAF